MENISIQSYLNKKPTWLPKKKKLWIAVGIVLILTSAALFIRLGDGRGGNSNQPTIEIQKSYGVVARTEEKQRTTGRFTLTVNDATFADNIIIQGKKAKAVNGKTFLVLDMEIENPHKVQLYAFPVDLFRLIRDDGKKIAPSVHQGSVLIRPESTKKSNVGFVVEPDDKHFRIEVGEIGNQKEILEINF